MKSISKFTLLSFAVFLCIFLSVHFFLFLPLVKKNLISDANQRVFDTLESTAENIENYLDTLSDYVFVISQTFNAEIIDNPYECQKFLNLKAESAVNFDNGLFIFNKNGDLMAEYPYISPERKGENFGFREYFRETVYRKNVYISKTYLSSKTNSPSVMISAPVMGKNNEVVGVIGGSLNLLSDNPLGLLVKKKVDEKGYFYLYSTGRTIILHPDINRVMKNDVPPGVNKIFDMGIEGVSIAGENVNSRGLKAITGVYPIKNTEWILGLNIPIDLVYGDVKSVSWAVNVIFVVLFLFVIVFVFMSYRLFIRPLFMLVEDMNKIPSEKSLVEIKSHSNFEEIQFLTSSINRLMNMISRKQREILSFINGTDDMILQHDIDGDVFLFNDSLMLFLGINPVSSISKTFIECSDFLDMLEDMNKFKFIKYILLELHSGNENYSEVYTLENGQSEIYLKINRILIDNVDFKGFFTVIQDITKQKLLTNELEEFKMIAEQSPLGIVITRPDTTIVYINRSVEMMTGYPAEELVGRKPSIFQSGKTEHRVYEELWKKLMNFNRHECEFTNRRKNGEIYFEKNVITPVFDKNGELINYVALKEDISIKKKYEEQQTRIDKLESIAMLSATISHDFKNLITSLSNFVEIVKVKIKDKELLNLCDSVKRTIESSTRISRQLISLGKDTSIKEVVDVYKTLKETCEFALKNRSVTYEILAGDGDFFVEADSNELIQVILNLLINASDAMEHIPDKHIRITLFKKVRADKKLVCVEIKDNGCGIPEKVKGKLFSPFFTTKKNGTGIGLLSCKNIMEKHGGEITFESEEGKGTVFRICLSEYFTKENSPKDVLYEPKNVRLAIIDDSEDIRLSTKMFFETAGIVCIDFSSRKDAVEYLKQCPDKDIYSNIITDLNIPGDIHWEYFVSEVKKISEDIPIIVFSGVFDDEFKTHYRKWGFSKIVGKPFNFDELLKTVLEISNK